MIFEPLKKCSEDGLAAEFKLTVTNIDALMSVRTPAIVMQNVPWFLYISRDCIGYLSVGLSPGIST